MPIRAASLDDTSLVVNLIVVEERDICSSIIAIPQMSLPDGSILDLPVNIGQARWNGTAFVDLAGNPIAFDIPVVEVQGAGA